MEKKFGIRVIIYLILALYAGDIQAQDSFYITKVQGLITTQGGDVVKAGATIDSRERLVFKDSAAYAYAIDNRNIIFSILPFELRSGFEESANLLASPIRPIKRALSDSQAKNNLSFYFGGKTFTVIGTSVALPVNATAYAFTDDFFLVFSFNGEHKQISKRIPFEKNCLIIDKNRLFETRFGELKSYPKERVEAFLFSPSTRKSQSLGVFNLQFIGEADMERELRLVADYFKHQNMDGNTAKQRLYDYFHSLYGEAEPNRLAILINKVME